MKQIKILIVQGELTSGKKLALELESFHNKIIEIVDSGEKAIQTIDRIIPDLILIGIDLQGKIDGITTIAKINLKHSIPTIYITSHKDKDTLKRARETKPRGYLIKPYDIEDLTATIDQIFESKNSLKNKIQQIQQKTQLATHKVKTLARKTLGLPSIRTHQYQKKREQYKKNLNPLSVEDAEIVKNLEREGVHITSFAELRISHTKRLVKQLTILHPHLYTLSHLTNWRVGIPSARKFYYNEILYWGLGERLLDIIENYIGLPLLFHGVDLRRDIANNPIKDARQWHLDIDDERMIKVIIYLNNVSKNGGPFEYISRNLTAKIAKTFDYTSGYITDSEMGKVVPPEKWKICSAKAGNIIIIDPCNIFHRAKPAKSNRYSLTFGYTSINPKVHLSQFKLSPKEWNRIAPNLSDRQIACLKKE